MKIQYALIGLLVTSVAHSNDFGLYANSVAAHNIAAAQHTISNRVFTPIGKSMAAVSHANETNIAPTEIAIPNDPEAYGEMLYYGEFGDDTGVLPLVTGHSGGDVATNEFLRIGWQHFSDNVDYSSHANARNTSDLAFIGYGKDFNASRLEFFGGYSGGHTNNTAIDMDTDGAFVGARFGKRIDAIELSAMADFGIAGTDVQSASYNGDFNNFYLGVMANVAYEYNFDNALIMRPTFRAGYTWVNSANYISSKGDNVSNKDFGFFELTPMLDVFGDIGDGLSIGARFGYVINLAVGGKTSIDYITISKLDTSNYFDYGITLTQEFDEFSFNVNVGRHDGVRSGWNGGAEFKYMF